MGWVVSWAMSGRIILTISREGWGFQELGYHSLFTLLGGPQNCRGTCGHVPQLLMCYNE